MKKAVIDYSTEYSSCGYRVCCSFLNEKLLPKVKIQMIKKQNLQVDQTRLRGVCGKWKCCLAFEYENYNTVK